MVSILEIQMTLAIIVIFVSSIAGVVTKYSFKKSGYQAYQAATITAIIIVALIFLIILSIEDQIPQEIVSQFTVLSLIFAMLAIAMTILQNVFIDQQYANWDSKITKIDNSICQDNEDPESIIGKITSMESTLVELKKDYIHQVELIEKTHSELEQLNQSQRNKDSISETSEPHN